ncbi:MAG: molecular chaperone DjiA [Pseudomonadota bacterium]|nr:molecular chaperone DjiA [Pseudomonadota bacterium]
MSIWSKISSLLSQLVKGDSLSNIFAQLRTPPEKTIGFTIAIISLAAKMAKADGSVTHNEITAFKEIFHVPKKEEKNAKYVFNLAQKDSAGFEYYARRIKKMLHQKRWLLEDIIEGLFYIAIADGNFHPAEERFINTVGSIFGVRTQALKNLKARYTQDHENDPYHILGVSPESDLKDIKKKWRKLIQENHPDQIFARGLPREAINLANSRTAIINLAWEKIKASNQNLADTP